LPKQGAVVQKLAVHTDRGTNQEAAPVSVACAALVRLRAAFPRPYRGAERQDLTRGPVTPPWCPLCL